MTGHAAVKRRSRTTSAIVSLSLLGCGTWASSVNAEDLLFQLTSPAYQDSLALGKVIAVQDQQLTFQPQSIVMGDRLPRRLTLDLGEQQAARNLAPDDFAILSLVKQQGQYQLSFDAFEVDSLDRTQTRILSGPLRSDNWAFNWFINSCGQEADFSFDHSNSFDTEDISAVQAFVRRDGVQVPIGFKQEHRWKRTAQPLPCQPRSNGGWWRSLLQRVGFWRTSGL